MIFKYYAWASYGKNKETVQNDTLVSKMTH